MRQRDIERVMAAAWAVARAPEYRSQREADENLERLLMEIDPHGVYRPGAPTAGMDCQADFQTLRESPKL